MPRKLDTERSCFDGGDLGGAQRRLQEFADEACRCLDVKSINTLACTIATYLDVLMGDMAKRPDRITLEIKQERREQARWWKKLRTEGQETIL